MSEPDLKKRTKALAFRIQPGLVPAAKLTEVKKEADELIAIIVASIKTPRHNRASYSAIRIPHSALV